MRTLTDSGYDALAGRLRASSWEGRTGMIGRVVPAAFVAAAEGVP